MFKYVLLVVLLWGSFSQDPSEEQVLVFTDIHIDYLYDLAKEKMEMNAVLKNRLRFPTCNREDTDNPYLSSYG